MLLMSDRQSDISTIAVFSGAARLSAPHTPHLLCRRFISPGSRQKKAIVASIYLAFSVAGIMNRKNVPGKIVLDIPLLLPGLLAIAIY